ncbi:stage II sporulation protein P [Alkalihalobacillus alcalophilus ATCC 27647 = CGMCC 1.3604]|uniref:Stage II sporulation protein P n=1 Tax=Alkalihalobacillus alcalophilus ATCC 27647 = CGMCC 1.3604 TaxID=1218173 RepID=A0A094YWN1_ALKAL|nr:stage II sporulation protein P [Alkalihalobacillus alcalophilus]KGA97932.1 stage II sporulation protein P [Alkalihalobacillus alcalophilus ATCC 27647 = CGMCC 1.3604]MED1562708.1 stage II sporulation protein P [Alkalihalobacillus alcalophilus]THG92335.1 stage II sporulation protein P [Alkalihalobacillus alcalophilus ATCC 27647 = CGMCC 1.3604]
MKSSKTHSTAPVQNIVIMLILSMISIFIIIGALTTFQTSLTSDALKRTTYDISVESLFYFMSMENHYFSEVLPAESQNPSIGKFAFELITNINFDDPRTFLGRELPGFSFYDGTIVVAGEGSDFTNMPTSESAPPMDVILAEREAASENLANMNEETSDERNDMSAESRSTQNKIVHIIHSHSRESFLPELKNASEPDDAWHAELNVTLVGERLGKELEKRGIGTEVDKTDISGMLSERSWSYPQSYEASRDLIKTAMEDNQDLEFFFEIHRDALRRDITTVTINGIEYARTYFVIGKNNPNYEKNQKLAEDLHYLLEKQYPGLSRGVLVKDGTGINGRYNQDLSENSILIEMGGVDNTLEESYRTTEALAEIISDYYWNSAEKVNN